jgi:transcriptional regulator with PAS, ATPase and Fis domain
MLFMTEDRVFLANGLDLQSFQLDTAISLYLNNGKQIAAASVQNKRKCKMNKKEEVQCIQFPQSLPTIKEVTWQLVEEAMKRADRNQSAAAKMLGISQQALSKRLKKKRSS